VLVLVLASFNQDANLKTRPFLIDCFLISP